MAAAARKAANDVASPAILGGEAIPESGTVTVGCKLPQGLVLRVFRMVDQQEQVMGGGVRDFKIGQPTGEVVRIHGYGEKIAAIKAPLQVIGDYAYTPNVDAAFFAEWVRQNADSEIVKKGLIFCHKSSHSAEDMGKERISLRTGFEPLNPKSRDNPKGDPRIPGSANPNLSRIETLDKKAD